jgi:hypothetical protein
LALLLPIDISPPPMPAPSDIRRPIYHQRPANSRMGMIHDKMSRSSVLSIWPV